MNGTRTQNRKAEIVVIGGGASGLAAAVAAVENGARSVLVLEKQKAPGGNAIFAAGIFAVGSDLQRRLGLEVSADEAFVKLMSYAHWRADARLIRTLVTRSLETLHWLEGKGIVFEQIVMHSNQPPHTYHAPKKEEDGTGLQAVRALTSQCRQSEAVSILCGTSARRILLDESGAVAGVVADSSEGEVRIEAEVVIVCTGGFSGNEELIRRYVPGYIREEAPPIGFPQMGEGIRMATEIGADLDGMASFEWVHFFADSPYLSVLARRPIVLLLNRRGERFIDEDVPSPTEIANAVSRQPGKEAYCLFDEAGKQAMAAQELGPFEDFFVTRLPNGPATAREFAARFEADLPACAEKGSAKISSSLDEIANWMGADPETLRDSVEEYNGFSDRGHDELFAKRRAHLLALRTPPFYALRCGLRFLNTHGGIKINHRMQALKPDHNPIPGLYAAGNETGATDGDTYDMFLPGHALGFAISMGRIAGEQAAAYIARKQQQTQ
jgi:fumarate reductase flavoprotein subunit